MEQKKMNEERKSLDFIKKLSFGCVFSSICLFIFVLQFLIQKNVLFQKNSDLIEMILQLIQGHNTVAFICLVLVQSKCTRTGNGY